MQLRHQEHYNPSHFDQLNYLDILYQIDLLIVLNISVKILL